MCKNTILPLTLTKWGFKVSNGNEVNTKVEGNDNINQIELEHEFFGILDNSTSHTKTLQWNPQRVPISQKGFQNIPKLYKSNSNSNISKIH